MVGGIFSLVAFDRLKSLLPRAKVHRDGAMAYDPDTAPSAPMSEED